MLSCFVNFLALSLSWRNFSILLKVSSSVWCFGAAFAWVTWMNCILLSVYFRCLYSGLLFLLAGLLLHLQWRVECGCHRLSTAVCLSSKQRLGTAHGETPCTIDDSKMQETLKLKWHFPSSMRTSAYLQFVVTERTGVDKCGDPLGKRWASSWLPICL